MFNHGKKFLKAKKKIIFNKKYSLKEACSLVLKTKTTKFNESVDVAINLGINTSDSSQIILNTVMLPYAIGKKVIIAVFANGIQAQNAELAGADIVAGHNTFAANLVKYMGANYQANKSYNTWPILTIEKLLRNTPDIIIVTQGSVALKQLKIKLAPVLNLKKFKYCKLLASKNEILTRPGIYIYEDAKIVQTLIDNNR